MRKIFLLLIVLLLKSQISFSTQIDTTRMYGLTLDAVNGLNKIDTSLARLCKKPTTRIVFDEFVAATYYQTPVNEISKFSFIMGEILDSYYMPQYTLQQYIDRTNEYLNLLGSKVDIWEIGNEINGEWLGNTSDVVAKMNAAYSIIKAANKKTELTLYYNKNCWSNPANEMFRWAQTNISTTMKNNLDYVLISYYEDDCNNLQPNWQQVFDSLHTMFPNSKIGFGECGTTTANKAAYISRYYRMNITTHNYIGGYFWWYYKQDCVPYTDPLWTTFNNSISNYAPPATQASQITSSPLSLTSLILSWTNGNGSKRAVFVKDAGSGVPNIQDGVTYIPNTIFGQGTSDGNGWYCVYNGSSAGGLTITGLTPLHSYIAMILEYNGFSGFEGYNRNASTNNPVIIQGLMPVELVSFTSTVERNNVRLKWTTNNEVNNKGFNVERTLKANSENWVDAGFINGNGNINVPVKYEFVDKNIPAGNYKYRLKQIDYNGNFEYHNLSADVIVGTPSKFELSQNYPNPFNPTTNISFGMPVNSKVTIKIYDISGREIRTLLNDTRAAGYYTVMFDASGISSGVYFYKIQTDGFSDLKRMLLVK